MKVGLSSADDLMVLVLFLQAREAGQLLLQEVDSLTARLTSSASSSLSATQHLAEQVGVVSDVCVLPIMHQSSGDVELMTEALLRLTGCG